MLPAFQASRFELLPFVGPPSSLLLWAAFGAMTYADAAVVWSGVMVTSAALLMIIPARLALRRIGRADAVSLLLLALSYGPLVTGISVGQAALPAVAAVGVAILCAARRQWLPMAAATIAAGILKPNDALVIAATARELAASLALASSAIISGLASLSVAHGIHGVTAYLEVLLNQWTSERLYAYQFTPASIAYGFGMASHAAATLGTIVSVAAMGVIVAAIRFTRASLVDGAAIACALFPFVLPFEHEPDMVIALLPALLVVFRASGWTWGIGAVGAVLLCANPFALTQGWPGLVFVITMAGVASLQLAALAPIACKRARFVPLFVVPMLMLGIGLFAPSNHLPLWPATLPAHVTVAPGASAAAVWRDELIASQLEKRLPWVSLLRTLTLCGCACVGAAMIRTAIRGSEARP